MSDRIIVGTLGGAFGVSGEVRLKSFCADPAAIGDYAPLSTEDGATFPMLVLTGQIKGGFTGRVQGIETKEDADALRNVSLYAARSKLPSLPDDEYYYADLVGLTVVDTGNEILGTVKAVENHGAGDIIEINLTGQSNTMLLPFTHAIVPTVDIGAGRIIVDPPETF
jgi:16S rRNA processing protein RimM